MNFTMILMRHGQSEHNIAKRDVKRKLKMKKIKKTKDYQSIKYLPSLRDDSLTEEGCKSAQNAAKILDWENICYVFVSPLKRCLQTCQIMKKTVNFDAEIFIQPLLMSRVTNSWSLGSEKSQLVKKFPLFDFNCLSDNEIPWYVQNLKESDQMKFVENKQNEMAVLSSGVEQSYYEFHERGRKLKWKINNIMDNNSGKRVLFISHSCTLKLFTATGMEKQGKLISNITFENTDPIYIQKQSSFSLFQPSPKF